MKKAQTQFYNEIQGGEHSEHENPLIYSSEKLSATACWYAYNSLYPTGIKLSQTLG